MAVLAKTGTTLQRRADAAAVHGAVQKAGEGAGRTCAHSKITKQIMPNGDVPSGAVEGRHRPVFWVHLHNCGGTTVHALATMNREVPIFPASANWNSQLWDKERCVKSLRCYFCCYRDACRTGILLVGMRLRARTGCRPAYVR